MLISLVTFLFEKVRNQFPKWLRTWISDIIIGPATVLLLVLSESLIRWIDPTAATFDLGVIQSINVALIKMAIYSTVVNIMVRHGFKNSIWKYFKNEDKGFVDDFNMQQWSRPVIALGVWFLLFALCAFFDQVV